MKVLIVSDYGTPTGGAEHMSLSLREGLRRRGHEARFFSSTARSLEVPIVADHTCFGTDGPLRRVTQAINPFASAALKRLLRSYRPDLVHVRMFLTQLSPTILRALRDVPALLHVVNYDLICPINTKLLPDGSRCTVRPGWVCYRSGCMSLAGMARYAVQRSLLWSGFDEAFDMVVTNSQWVRRRLEAEGVRVDATVWNGVPLTAQRPPLAEGGLPMVAFAGRLVAKKGVGLLIEAMAQARRRVPQARLVIAGDGPERTKLQKLTSDLGLEASVEFLGHVSREEMERAFAAAWVQAAPSLWEEPFGLVGAEAMMRGTAAIVSDAGGLSEQVEDGVTGYRVPAGDVRAWADVLARVLSDRTLCERLGAAGRQRALAHFTEDRVLDQFLALYGQIITARAGAVQLAEARA